MVILALIYHRYNQVNNKEKVIEVVYIHSDETKFDFWDTYKDKPWLSIPFEDENNMKLKALFSIASVPVLVIIKRNGYVVTYSGREGRNY